MGKLLSQEEIDALLTQTDDKKEIQENDDDLIQKEIRRYDFRHPDRVSKDQQKILRTIHESMAKFIATFLSNKLRSMIDIKSPTFEQVTYLEYTMSASDFTNMFIFEVDKLDGQAILEFDPNLTFFIIDRLFGGVGSTIKKNEITIIEQTVMSNIAKNVLEHFKESWMQVDELEPSIKRFEVNPQLVTIAPASETMIVLNFPVIAKSNEFFISFCFPYFMLEPILKKLLSQNYMTLLKKKSSDKDQKNLLDSIKMMTVPLTVEIGKLDLMVEEFVDLQKGDVLVLNKTVDEYLVGRIADENKFIGTIGKHHNKMRYKIKYLLDGEGEIINGKS
ncbi:MAG: flagellar motor switch protein FliM [Candidatus Cloacimonadota bacterium]|nr:flagellar motor switch protein FliM [Candidatus Cloacimonadota bacterium]